MLKSEDEVKVKTVQFDSTHMFEGEWYRTDYAKSRDWKKEKEEIPSCESM